MGGVRPAQGSQTRDVRAPAPVDDDACLATASCKDTIAPRPAAPLLLPPNIDLELLEPSVSLRDLMRLQTRRGGGARRADPSETSRAEARRYEQERARREEERRRLDDARRR